MSNQSLQKATGSKKVFLYLSEKLQEAAALVNQATKGKPLWYAGIFLIAVIFLGYYFSVIFFMTNFPFNDDYVAILKFTLDYKAANTWYEKLAMLFEQHNEHRIFFSRVCTLLSYKINGETNFTMLNFIGNLSLILICILLQKTSLILRKNIIYALPVFFLVMNFRHYELAFWAMASLQNFWVIVFAFGSLYFLAKEKKTDFVLALVLALLACFNSGNGMMTFIAGMFLLFVSRGADKRFFVWLLFSCISIAFYFLTYKSPPTSPDVLKNFVHDPTAPFLYGLAFLGSAPTLVKEKAIAFGLVILFFIFFLWKKKYYKVNSTISAFILFILLTAAINTAVRFNLGVFTALSPRYSIYSVLLTACLYIAFTELYKGRWKEIMVLLVLVLSVAFHLWSYKRFIPYSAARKENFQQLGQVNYVGFDFGVADLDKAPAQKYLQQADSAGIYKFSYRKQLPEASRYALSKTRKINYSIDRYEENDSTFIICGWAFLPYQYSTVALPLIRVAKNSVVVKDVFCERLYRHDLQEIFPDVKGSKFSGFATEISRKNLPSGEYDLHLCFIDGDSIICEKGIKKIEIKK